MDIKKDELVKGSLILIIMLGIFNIFNYLFQISMAKLLGPAEFSAFAVLMSFIYIFGIPSEAIQTVVARYTSKFNAKKKTGKIKDFFYRSMKKGFLISLGIFFIFIIVSFFVSGLLGIPVSLLVITGLFIVYSFTIPVARGVLQGKKKFFAMGGNLVIESVVKFVFSIILVLIGFKVYGAIGSIIIGSMAAFFIVFFSLKDVLKSRRAKENFGGIFSYNIPVLIGMTSIILIYSLDVIIARFFFSPEISGKYAFVSLIAKSILFASFAIGKAMFPISSERFERKTETSSLFKKSILLTSVISIAALVFFLFFPEFVIKVISLFDTRYLDASNVLFILGLGFSFAAFSYILILYNISVNKMKKSAYGLLIFIILEFILLGIFNSNLVEFSISLTTVNFLMLLYNLWILKK
ncbi:hypothetical protein FJZ19_01815 [Candidatus Pacearchaeota archaeon]|nr:hypothetical protein [Candidatus Pacearchaeota archaeon]